MPRDTEEELTTEHARQCANYVLIAAMRDVAGKPQAFGRHVRDWMAANVTGTPTTRVDMQDAVLHYLEYSFETRIRPEKPIHDSWESRNLKAVA